MKPYATYSQFIVMCITSFEVYTLVPFRVYYPVALVPISPTWLQVLRSPRLLGCIVIRPVKSATVYQGYWRYKPPYIEHGLPWLLGAVHLHLVIGGIHHGWD